MGSDFEAKSLHEIPFAVLDFETTGLNASSDRVVQVGVVHCGGKLPLKLAVGSLVNPQCSIDPRVSRIHGITNAHVEKSPTFGDIAGQVISALEGRVVAAYNASFDLRFLRAELRRSGLAFESPFICVMELRQMIFAERKCRLVEACKEMGIPLAKAHDATSDAHATALLLQRYIEVLRKQDVQTIERLRGFGQCAFTASFVRSGFSASTSAIIGASQRTSDDALVQLERDCERLNNEATEALARLESLLVAGLKADVRVKWDRLMAPLNFQEPMPAMPVLEEPEKPDLALKPDPSQKPSRGDAKYSVDDGMLFSLVPWLKEQKLKAIEQQYLDDLEAYKQRIVRWNRIVTEYRTNLENAKTYHAERMRKYEEAFRQFKARRTAHIEHLARQNARIEQERSAYERGHPDGIARAMTRVLMNSALPTEFPGVVDLELDKSNARLNVVRQLPSIDEMPAVKAYRVVKKDREIKEQSLSDAARKRLFDAVVYQMALRTIHEIFRGDTAKQVQSVDVRCVVEGFDPATGHPGWLVIARLCTERQRMANLRLENVDPEVCFKELGGETNSRPSNLKPVEVLLAAQSTG